MNEVDALVLRAIRAYQQDRGKYPERVEVTDDVRRRMTCDRFQFPQPLSSTPSLSVGWVTPDTAPSFEIVQVPVVPVGDYVMTRNDRQVKWSDSARWS